MSVSSNPIFRYFAALVLTLAALLLWSLWAPLHESPFVIFIAVVMLSARYFGFGPGIFATALSLFLIDYVVLDPHFAFSHSTRNLEHLSIFLLVSILATSLARQKGRADIRAEHFSRQLAAIVENSAEAILSKDAQGIITSWNHGAEQLYGYRADEVIGKHVSLLVPPEQPDEIPGIMARLLRGEHIQNYMADRVHRDGTRLTVYLSISPIRNNRGEIVGASTLAQDLTSQKRAEEALFKNEKLAMAGRLAASIAHEINNPLEAIGNLLYLARRDHSRSGEYLAMAEREIQRLANIAQQTLGLVRDAASATPLNVSMVLDEVLRLYMRKLNNKKIHVAKEYEETAEIRGFPGELRQVFSNLIANAIDAMSEHGSLRLRVDRTREWSNGGRPGVRVTIADTGHGIAPNDAARVFEPFFTTKKDSGTGLGLWLSYNIIQKHGGSIRLRSRVAPGNCGTVFRLFLPSIAQPAKAETSPA
jgi:PAS domain S-box-containing protein